MRQCGRERPAGGPERGRASGDVRSGTGGIDGLVVSSWWGENGGWSVGWLVGWMDRGAGEVKCSGGGGGHGGGGSGQRAPYFSSADPNEQEATVEGRTVTTTDPSVAPSSCFWLAGAPSCVCVCVCVKAAMKSNVWAVSALALALSAYIGAAQAPAPAQEAVAMAQAQAMAAPAVCIPQTAEETALLAKEVHDYELNYRFEYKIREARPGP